VDRQRRSAVRHPVYRIEREVGEVLTVMVRSREDWHSELFRASPLYASVEREGVAA
jgi:hypothetical protein